MVVASPMPAEQKNDEDFQILWALPDLPLTEKFGRYSPEHAVGYDQALVISRTTGHVQLLHQLPPATLYTESAYSFRTGESAKSRQGVAFFLDFFRRYTHGNRFRSIVDVGGNDLYVARAMQSFGDCCTVIDPICAAQDGEIVDGIRIIGRLMEQVDLRTDMPPPDLVICRHTLEHVSDPESVVRQWFRQTTRECLFFVEVPSLECLRESLRFDAIFHQHLHYFDLDSLSHLIWRCGGEVFAHAINRDGSCGGNLLIAFRKADSPERPSPVSVQAKIEAMLREIAHFDAQMATIANRLSSLPKPIFGYGAGLMLATYAYHLKSDLSQLDCILDDDPFKNGGGYENLPVKIALPSLRLPPPGASYLITSLENLRPIAKRIFDLVPARILVPNVL
ncbi:MAG: class I SAM-dependent methyltransferase [Opitutaceae bacterium]|nr:class I SAM-dependent methyltransferase [Opitutaceae bacterium]